MKKGKIKTITDRGFGFITEPGNSNDIFFHQSNLLNAQIHDLREGDEVAFDIQQGEKGPSAINVQIAKED